jgi:hypothetical protein
VDAAALKGRHAMVLTLPKGTSDSHDRYYRQFDFPILTPRQTLSQKGNSNRKESDDSYPIVFTDVDVKSDYSHEFLQRIGRSQSVKPKSGSHHSQALFCLPDSDKKRGFRNLTDQLLGAENSEPAVKDRWVLSKLDTEMKGMSQKMVEADCKDVFKQVFEKKDLDLNELAKREVEAAVKKAADCLQKLYKNVLTVADGEASKGTAIPTEDVKDYEKALLGFYLDSKAASKKGKPLKLGDSESINYSRDRTEDLKIWSVADDLETASDQILDFLAEVLVTRFIGVASWWDPTGKDKGSSTTGLIMQAIQAFVDKIPSTATLYSLVYSKNQHVSEVFDNDSD